MSEPSRNYHCGNWHRKKKKRKRDVCMKVDVKEISDCKKEMEKEKRKDYTT